MAETGTRRRWGLSEAVAIVAGALLASIVAILTTWMNSQSERVRDEMSFFRQERREVYSQFLRSGGELIELRNRLEPSGRRGRQSMPSFGVPVPLGDPERIPLDQKWEAMKELTSEIRLIGGQEVYEVADEAVSLCGAVVNEASGITDHRGSCRQALARFLSAARRDLGISE